MAMDFLKYTEDEIIKNLALTETHLKQAASGVDELFCKDCINKHLFSISGLADEGLGFTEDENKIKLFEETAKIADDIREKDYTEEGIELASELRDLRKKFTAKNCSKCNIISNSMMHDKKGEMNLLPKHLNTNSALDYYNLNKLEENGKMAKIFSMKEVSAIGVGQFVGQGFVFLAEMADKGKVVSKDTMWKLPSTYIGLAGGLVLPYVGMRNMLKNKAVSTACVIGGTNMLATEVVKLLKVAGGKIIPTQYTNRMSMVPQAHMQMPNQMPRVQVPLY
jgi:hypothetical protein